MSIEDTKRKRVNAQHLADTEGKGTSAKRQRPIVGTYAQVSLLPRELLLTDRRRVVRRRLIAGVVVTAVVVAAGVAGSAALATSAASDLAQQEQQSALLAQRLQKYQDVQKLESQLALDKAAARVGSSTAIDWDPEIDRIKGSIPAGFKITAIATDSATPILDYTQGGTPLDRTRAASVTITARAASIASLPGWISAVTALPEVADASPSVNTGDGGSYTVVLTVHLTTKAYITPLTTGPAQ
jgi:hypothetical protein